MDNKYHFKLTVELSPDNPKNSLEEAKKTVEEVLDYITLNKSKMGLHDLWSYELEAI